MRIRRVSLFDEHHSAGITKGFHSKLGRWGLLTALVCVLAPVTAARASGPAYSFAEIGKIDTIGGPVGVSDDGTVATSYGVWSKGTFVNAPVGPSDGGALRAISPSGLVLGVSGQAICGRACFFTWDPKTGTITPYPVVPEGLDPSGAPCGGFGATMLDSANEAGGALAYLNASHHPHCTAGDTTTIGAYVPAPGGQPVRIPQLYKAFSLAPGFALGLGTDQTTTTLLNRATGATTRFPTLELDQTGFERLASDGAFVATGKDFSPDYVSPTGVITALAPGRGQTYVTAINDGHASVGIDTSDGGVLWPTPTSAPVELNSLLGAGIPPGDDLSDARYIGNRGDIVGTSGTSANDSVYVLSVAPSLTASIAVTNADGSPFTGAGTKIGDTLKATVTLTNASATQPVTGLTVTPPLSVSPASSLQATGGPAPAPPTDLAAGATAQYRMTYTIMGKGTATLSLTANGTQNGHGISADASTVAHLGQPISVSIAFKKDGTSLQDNTFKLADDDNGEIPQVVTAVLTLKNESPAKQDHVSFNGPLIPSFHTAAQALPTNPVTVTAGPAAAAGAPGPYTTDLPDLAPGATVQRTYTLLVRKNGVFDVSSQVLSADEGGTGTNVSTGLGTLTADPTALVLLSLHRAGGSSSAAVRAGTPVLVFGTLTNLSQTHPVDLAPVEPNVGAGENAGGTALTDASASPLPDGVVLPLAGPIAPAAVTQVQATVDTAPATGSRAHVAFAPSGFVVGDDGARTALTGDQVRLTAGSSPVEIALDPSPPAVKVDQDTLFYSFTKPALELNAQWWGSHLHSAAELLRHPVRSTVHGISGLADFTVGTAGLAQDLSGVLGAVSVFAQEYKAMSPYERYTFAKGIADDYAKTNLFKVTAATTAEAETVMKRYFDAYFTGDYNKAAGMVSTGLSTGAGVVADALLTDLAFQKIKLRFRGAPAAADVAESPIAKDLTLQQSVIDHKAAPDLLKNRNGLGAGVNLLAEHSTALKRLYGLSTYQIKRVREYCAHNGIILAIRGRSARAAELIKKGIATAKNLVVKLKNVDPVDVQFLDYNAGDLNTVVWAEPISDKRFLHNLHRAKHLTAEQYEIAENRFAARKAESRKKEYRDKIHEWTLTKRITLMFDGASSGLGELDAERTVHRRFEAVQDRRIKDRVYERLMVGVKAGENARLARITQDVDAVAVLGGNGSVLPRPIAAKVMSHLMNFLDIEHPDTLPWVKDGEFFFEAKTKLLADHLPGGEALAVFDPSGGVRTAFINPHLSVYNPTTRGGFLALDGAYSNPYAPIATGALAKLIK